MKKILLFLLIFSFSNYIVGQSQIGFSAGIVKENITTNDFINYSSINGYSIGITSLSAISQKSDLIVDLIYEKKSFDIKNYIDYYYNVNNFNSNDIVKINSFNLIFLYNRYIIFPESKSFYFSIQGGLGSSLYEEWTKGDDTFFKEKSPINPYYIFGLSGGTEQFRVSIRYNHSIGSYLRNINVNEIPNGNNNYNSRELNGTLNSFSIQLTYFLKPFHNN